MSIQNQNNLLIDGNLYRPEIDFNPQSGVLTISGRSILENTITFYEPVVDWLKQYCNYPATVTTFNIMLEYFNTSSSKYLLTMVELLEELYMGGNDVIVNWFYGDEDMMELGEDYQNMFNIPFLLKQHVFVKK